MNEGEDDKLIAKFMGWEGTFLDRDAIHHDHIAQAEAIPPKGKENWDVYTVSLRYRYSWDWLMPVVEKIESLSFEVSIIDTECEIGTQGYSYRNIVCNKGESKIEGVYKTVIEFIRYYNDERRNTRM